MAIDMTTFDPALKDYYTNDKVEDLVFDKNPLLMLVDNTEGGGRRIPIPVIFGHAQNVSANATTAFAGTSNSSYESFDLTRVKLYNAAEIDGETILASGSDKGAWFKALTAEIDGALSALGRSIAVSMYRSGWGDIGVIGSINSTTITLATASDAHNFEVGMKVVFADSQSSSTLKSATAVSVTAVDRSSGTVTISATTGSPAANDYIFREGNRENSATPTRLVMAGLEAWVPASAPSATSFFGVDRSVDSRLGGLRLDASSMPIEEALIEAESIVATNGGKLTHFFLNPKRYAELCKSLQGKFQYVDVTRGNVSLRAIEVNGQMGAVTVVPDTNCPYNRGFGLDIKTWKTYTMNGGVAKVLDQDGLKIRAHATKDSYVVRVGFYGNLGCSAPGWNINVQF